MIRLMCEQMFNGLDNLVTRTLNEKKQEISPEDQRDNELIRSAMIKRTKGRTNAKLTKAEEDALERNGWSVDGRTFKTANGVVEFRDKRNSWYDDDERVAYPLNATNHSKNTKRLQPVWLNVRGEPSKINLADMGRKQKERAENNPFSKSIDIREKRGAKLQKGKTPERVNGYWNLRDYKSNRLTAERDAQNRDLIGKKSLYKTIKQIDSDIAENNRDIEYTYDSVERDRQSYLDQIRYYKQKLSELDSNTEGRVARYVSNINDYKNEKSKLMNQERERFANRHNKNESYRRVKHER